ncbi:MAG: hypothetical protein ACFB2X_03370 [Rivularia sp. (in: cyanobacteria)]
MKYDSFFQGLDISYLLDDHLLNFFSSKEILTGTLDDLINLHLINLAKNNSGLDINRLLDVLEKIKRDCEFKPDCKLTRFEQRYFCLLLRGYSGREFAFIHDENRIPTKEELIEYKDKLEARIKNLRKEASKGLNKYLKSLLGLDESVYLPRTVKLIQMLKEQGYGINSDRRNEATSALFIKSEITAIEIIEILKQAKPDLRLEVREFVTKK